MQDKDKTDANKPSVTENEAGQKRTYIPNPTVEQPEWNKDPNKKGEGEPDKSSSDSG